MRISQGKYFPKGAINGGYLMLAIGVLGLFGHILVGLPFLLLGIYLSFTYGGIEIDNNKKKFREYAVYFGILVGSKWKDLNKYTDLCILKTRESITTFARSNTSVTYKDSFYDLFLLTPSHRTKVFLKRFDSKEAATSKARELERVLHTELKVYSPKGSVRV